MPKVGGRTTSAPEPSATPPRSKGGADDCVYPAEKVKVTGHSVDIAEENGNA